MLQSRSRKTHCTLVATCLVATSIVLQAIAADAPYSVTARQMSRSTVLGVRIGAESSEKRGKLASGVSKCVRAIDEDALSGVYARLMRERMSAADIQLLDAFYASEVGGRYFRWSINALRTMNNLDIVDPVKFDDDEIQAAEEFHAQGAGKVLSSVSDGTDPAAREAIKHALSPLLASCMR